MILYLLAEKLGMHLDQLVEFVGEHDLVHHIQLTGSSITSFSLVSDDGVTEITNKYNEFVVQHATIDCTRSEEHDP